MRKFAISISCVISLFAAAALLHGQQSSGWLNKEFSGSVLAVDAVESFINDVCRPSGLDDIQLLGVQTGHNDVFHLHVYCKQGAMTSPHYKVRMVQIPNRNPDAAVNQVLGSPNIRVGPFYFGADGQPDAFVMISSTK